MSLPSKAKIFEHWKTWLDKENLDWGEPSCWACGKIDNKVNLNKGLNTMKDIYNAWNNTNLQRCHIVPKSLGGSNDMSNLFLMCSECHDEAPDTTSKKIFLNWVKEQDYHWDVFEEAIKVFKMLGIDIGKKEESDKFCKIIKSENFKKWANENIASHFNQKNKGSKMKVSSYVAGLVGFDYETKININTANVNELKNLESIGKNKAKIIVKNRLENGSFESERDLLRVWGIGEQIFKSIENEITI